MLLNALCIKYCKHLMPVDTIFILWSGISSPSLDILHPTEEQYMALKIWVLTATNNF